MTRLRQIALAGLAAIAIGGVASSASAMESGTFQNRLNGATIGLPLGATPPPGLYTGLETAYLSYPNSGMNGHATGNQGAVPLPAIAQAVPLLWVPGWNWFGANYSASVVQAFYTFTACGTGCSGGAPITGGGFVYTNTFIQPINLSWNLGGGWFVATAFSVTVPDGTRQVGTPTRTTGPSNRRSPSRISATTGLRRRTSSTTSTPSRRVPAAPPIARSPAARRCSAI
jgi:hypothetical protein